jgi:hypothetical protein
MKIKIAGDVAGTDKIIDLVNIINKVKHASVFTVSNQH